MIPDQRLLYIEPRQPASAVPLIDQLTRKMSAAFRKGGPTDREWRGVHECVCGACSTNCDYRLPSGDMTNSLCVHYLAHHRSEVPPEQLARVNEFAFGEAEPNQEELEGPELVLTRIRASVEARLGPDRLGTWVAWGLDTAALCRSLQGGRLPRMEGLAEARKDAEMLLSILCSIEAKALPCFRESVQRTHGDLRSWAADALCVPGWKREAWPMALADLMRFADGDPMHRRHVATRFRLLGPYAGAALPALLELAKAATGDLQYDVGLALNDIERTPRLLLPTAAVPGLFEVAQEVSSRPRPSEKVRSKRSPTLQLSAALVLARAGVNTEYAVRALLQMALAGDADLEYAMAALCGTLHQTVGYVDEPGIENWGDVGLPLLLEALEASDWQIRARGIKLLGRLGRDAQRAVTALRKAAEDPKLRSHAEDALLRITSPGSADEMIEEKRAGEKAKAQVVVPPIDPNKPRHSQFFRFICPLCFQDEVVGLWYTSKTCSNCQKGIRIVKQPGYSECELIDSTNATRNPPERK